MTTPLKIAFVCPTYGQFEYARQAIASFLRYTPNSIAVIVDDASPDWGDPRWQHFLRSDPSSLVYYRFPKNGGLTRSWNWGIRRAIGLAADYVIAGNSDVLFCEGWYHGLIRALESGYSLAGPVSNAPGIASGGRADIRAYYPQYRLTDEAAYLDQLSQELQVRYRDQVVESRINGFFQIARCDTWWAGRFDLEHIYRPCNPEPTPLMTGNEVELQDRWATLGWKFAVCPSSFIFHYRSVTRGSRYCHGLWLRRTDLDCSERLS